jgi:DNA repair ATPase RecN
LKRRKDESQEQTKEIEILTKAKEELNDMNVKLNERNKILELGSTESKRSSRRSSVMSTAEAYSWLAYRLTKGWCVLLLS